MTQSSRIPGNAHSSRLVSGFTLIELLVVVAIIGILIAMLLPAVQQARESGRRVSCVNNVRQLGVAIHNFEATKKRLPAAGTYAKPETPNLHFSYSYWRIDLKSGTNYSWLVSLLPFMEEQSLFDQFNLSTKVTNNPRDPQAQQPASLLCPSDDARGRQFESVEPDGDRRVSFGKCNYAAFANVYHIDAWFYTAAIRLYGQQLRQITDGTTSTLVFAEIRTREHPHDQRGAWALPWSGSTLLSFDFHPSPTESSDSGKEIQADDYVPWPQSLGYTQYPNGPNPDVLYECPDLVGEQFDQMPCTTQYWGYISAAPRSLHPGGVNSVFLDGHVAFLQNDIDEYVMLHMVDPVDGK